MDRKIALYLPLIYHLRFTCDLVKRSIIAIIVFSTHAVKTSIKIMETLPVEVLEIVFRPLSKMEDIEEDLEHGLNLRITSGGAERNNGAVVAQRDGRVGG